MLLGSVSNMAIDPHLLTRVGYDPRKDFAVVSALARGPQMLVVHPNLPAKTVQEFLALARKKPNALICGSGGVGTPAHFGCKLLRLRGDAHLLHVPYKGTTVTSLVWRKGEPAAGVGGDAGGGCGIEAPMIDWRVIHIVRCIVRTNIVLDDKLVKEAMKLANVQTMREVVDLALQRFVQSGRQRKLLELYGSGGVRRGYDYKRTRSAA